MSISSINEKIKEYKSLELRTKKVLEEKRTKVAILKSQADSINDELAIIEETVKKDLIENGFISDESEFNNDILRETLLRIENNIDNSINEMKKLI